MGVRERGDAPDTLGIFVSFKVQSAGWEDLSSHPESLYNILERKKCCFLRRNRKYAGKESFSFAAGDKNAEKYFCAAKLHFPPHECCIAEDRIRRTDIPEGDGNIQRHNLTGLEMILEEPISPKGTETVPAQSILQSHRLEEPISPKGTESC